MQREAAAIRETWLGHALSTRPADRPAAEAAIRGLYRLAGLDPPRFHWASSPVTALNTVPQGRRLRPPPSVERLSEWTVPGRFSSLVTGLAWELDVRARWVDAPADRMIRRQVQEPLALSYRSALLPPLAAAHGSALRPGVDWYARIQCVSWLARYDALRGAAGVVFEPEQVRVLGLFGEVARSCGWWWPGEDVCVVAERPDVLRTEVWGDRGEVRPHCADGPAVRYADGWELYAWHGTPVPSWVITDPDIGRIAEERNVEVRRCAIERLGWSAYIDRAGLRLVASAPDPGNPGSLLHLYDLREDTRVLLAVNGSVERDGHRRRYGLTVPGFLDDPVAAAGWTYGLSAEQYALLARRT